MHLTLSFFPCTHSQGAFQGTNASVHSCNAEVKRPAEFKRATQHTVTPCIAYMIRFGIPTNNLKKCCASSFTIAVKPYHWKGDYGSGISSQIHP